MEDQYRRRDETRAMLQALKGEVMVKTSTSGDQERDEDVSMGEPSPAAAATTSTKSVSLISSKLLELVDAIE